VGENMEEKRNEFIPSHPSIMDVAKGLSEASKNAGRYKFLITFTATEGNLKVLQKFQRFSYDNCNNEYLVAINKLLDYVDIFNYLKSLDSRISILEEEILELKAGKVEIKEEQKEVKKEEGIKTF
jgi:hypothetical protein